MDNGFSLYNVSDGGLVQNYTQKDIILQRRVPKEAAFGEKNGVVVGGSNHGKVYIWNRVTGALLQQIEHPDGGMVQAVTVCPFKSFFYDT